MPKAKEGVMKVIIDGESVKERLRPIIESLVMILSDELASKEFKGFLDKKRLVTSCLDQIVDALKEAQAITVRKEE